MAPGRVPGGKGAAAWSVYVLRCADGTLYTGATNDLGRRLEQHQAGRGARYTRARLPVALHYFEGARDRGAALRREAALKRLPRAEKLRLPVRRPRADRERITPRRS
ncbi:MAG TPA: GIY-YIG nuclease family protein [Anaeromyxobacter sp.]|nr:GIY-YIG nuclease family protein [Anaeromyxobacter sp.]